MKQITINPRLPLNRCWDMVNRVDTIEKAGIAERWLRANEVITNDQFDDLMMALAWIVRELHRPLYTARA